MVYLVVADGIQQDDCVAAIFDDHAPEVFDRLCEWQLRQYVRQRCVKTLLQICANTTRLYHNYTRWRKK